VAAAISAAALSAAAISAAVIVAAGGSRGSGAVATAHDTTRNCFAGRGAIRKRQNQSSSDTGNGSR